VQEGQDAQVVRAGYFSLYFEWVNQKKSNRIWRCSSSKNKRVSNNEEDAIESVSEVFIHESSLDQEI
jgi:hypothetical protein